MPSIEMVRFVNSGGEATAGAVRLARGITGRDKIIKCAGCYHGSVDSLLVRAGSGPATLGIPETAGIPKSVASETIVVEFNDEAQLRAAFENFPDKIAAFIIEPVAANMGLVPPEPGYLELARELTRKHGALLIFDEVITGFRVAAGGAQQLFGIGPDITCLGKIIGGGMPVGAYGGRREIMEQVSPSGPIYQAGTLSGNPVAMAAGLAMLELIQAPDFYRDLERKTQLLCDGMSAVAVDAGVPFSVNNVCGMFGLFFTAEKVETYTQATKCDVAAFNRFFHAMLARGVYLAPSAFEAGFMSAAHSEQDLADTLQAAREAFRAT